MSKTLFYAIGKFEGKFYFTKKVIEIQKNFRNLLDRLFLLCYSEECYIMARYAYYAYVAKQADVVINKIKQG